MVLHWSPKPKICVRFVVAVLFNTGEDMKEFAKCGAVGLALTFGSVLCLMTLNLYKLHSEPLYKIRTNDGIYYAKSYKHFGHTVKFLDLDSGEEMRKSQDKLSGVVVERIN